MNVTVKHDGTDITNWVISYDREHDICTGVGSLGLIIPSASGKTFHPWDIIEVWENNNKKGKFYVSNLEEDTKTGLISLDCDDESKKLTDYFITESYLIDYLSYSKTWITKFLDEAQISYTFTVSGDGVPLSNNTNLGFDAAYSVITTLLQQSGWYIYFDPDGTAIIGELNKDINNPDHTIDAKDFSEFQRELDDDRLRNRAVVWGNTNPTYGEVFVDISVPTPWNYDADDKRAVVISNSSIFNNDQALALAQKLLNEFTKIKDEKYLLVANDYNMQLGEIVKVNSKFWNGRGLITSINATMSKDGLVYGITLDQNCPRMFTFYSTLPPTVSGFYVYTGHETDGIWRKHTKGSTWYNNSAGLESSYVDDLFIRNGTFATVLDDGYLYTKTVENSAWNKYNHGSLRDIAGNIYTEENIRAAACSINMSDNIIAGYNYVASGVSASGYIPASGVSWVLELTGGQSLIKAEQVVVSGSAGYMIHDLEATGEYNIVSVSGVETQGFQGFIPPVGGGVGYRHVQALKGGWANLKYVYIDPLPPDSNARSLAPPMGVIDEYWTSLTIGNSSGNWNTNICMDRNEKYYAIRSPSWSGTELWMDVLDGPSWTKTSYTIDRPDELTNMYYLYWFIRPKTTTTFDILAFGHVSSEDYKILHYSWTLGSSTMALVGSDTIPNTDNTFKYGAVLLGSRFILQYMHIVGGHKVTKVFIYNLVSHTGEVTIIHDYPGQGPGGAHTDNSWRAHLLLAGDTVYAMVYCIQTRKQGLNPGFFTSKVPVPIKTTLEISYLELTKWGGTNLVSDVEIDSVETLDDGNHSTSGEVYYPTIHGGPYASNPMTRFAYFRIAYRLFETDRWSSNWTYHLHGRYIRLPGAVTVRDNYLPYSNGDSYPPYSPNQPYHILISTGWWRMAWMSEANKLHNRFGGPWAKAQSEDFNADIETWYLINWPTGMQTEPNSTRLLNLRARGQRDDVRSSFVHGYGGYDVFSTPAGYEFYKMDEWTNTTVVGMMGRYILGYGNGYWSLRKASDAEMLDLPGGAVLKHTSTTTIEGFTASDDSLEQTQGIFENILDTEVPCKVDIAKDTPTLIYDIPTTISGGVSNSFAASLQNTPGSFYTHATVQPVYEARNFDLLKPGTFPTVSGTFNPDDYERFIGVCNQNGLFASKYTLTDPWVNMVTAVSGIAVSGAVVSGLITHFETSNYAPDGTYLFYTVSGVKTFYQKNPETSYWQDFSAGLPDSDITIIRCDDLI